MIVGKPNLSDRFKNIIKRYKSVGYNMDIMWHSACLAVNTSRFLFNCTTVGQASDLTTTPTLSFNPLIGAELEVLFF